MNQENQGPKAYEMTASEGVKEVAGPVKDRKATFGFDIGAEGKGPHGANFQAFKKKKIVEDLNEAFFQAFKKKIVEDLNEAFDKANHMDAAAPVVGVDPGYKAPAGYIEINFGESPKYVCKKAEEVPSEAATGRRRGKILDYPTTEPEVTIGNLRFEDLEALKEVAVVARSIQRHLTVRLGPSHSGITADIGPSGQVCFTQRKDTYSL